MSCTKMNARFLAACCLFIFTTSSVNGDIPRQCKPHSRSSGTLPKLPNAFTALVEANFVDKNYTMLLTEYYDDIRNRGAVTIVSGRGDGENKHEIFDYESNEIVVIYKTSGKCKVQSLVDHLPLFGFRLLDEKPHIKGVSQVLHFGREFNETYIGTTSVRGIVCNHWQACINTNYTSYTVDYYFASSAWNSSSKNDVTPVRTILDGSRTTTDNSTSMQTHSFYHIYDFFSFVAGSPKDDVFEIPRGTICPGKKNTFSGSLPAPKWFSFDSEWVSESTKTIHNFREFYDLELKLIRIDNQNISTKASERVFKREIHDYNTGVRYIIYNITGTPVCKMSILHSPQTWDAVKVDSHHVRIKSSRELLFLANFDSYGYEGVEKMRGFEANVWSTQRPDMTAEIYFLQQNWTVQTDSGLLEKQTPVRWTVKGRQGQWVANAYNFDASPQHMSVFDISVCYPWSKRHQINMGFGPLSRNIVIDENVFVKALRTMIAVLVQVTPIRIAGVRVMAHADWLLRGPEKSTLSSGLIWRIPPRFDILYVTFSLLDQPSKGLEGVSVNFTHVDSPSGVAVKKLEMIVGAGQFALPFLTANGTVERVLALPNMFSVDDMSLVATTRQPPVTGHLSNTGVKADTRHPDDTVIRADTRHPGDTPVVPTTLDNSILSKEPQNSDKVLTKGGVAGLVFGMLLLGLIIGIVGTVLFNIHRPLDDIAFKKHEEPGQSSQGNQPNDAQLREVHTNEQSAV